MVFLENRIFLQGLTMRRRKLLSLKYFIRYVPLSVLVVLCVSLLSYASSCDDVVTRIQKAYEVIQDLSGTFVQKSSIRDLQRTETYRGEFFIKRPLKMKWSYTGEQEQDVFINEDTILIYQKHDKQAFKARFDRETYGQAPLALLGGLGDIHKEFSTSEKDGMLFLKPKQKMGEIVSIEIVPSGDAFPIRSITIHDSYKNKIHIVLENVKVNEGLKDSLFNPSLPKTVTVLDYTS